MIPTYLNTNKFAYFRKVSKLHARCNVVHIKTFLHLHSPLKGVGRYIYVYEHLLFSYFFKKKGIVVYNCYYSKQRFIELVPTFNLTNVFYHKYYFKQNNGRKCYKYQT